MLSRPHRLPTRCVACFSSRVVMNRLFSAAGSSMRVLFGSEPHPNLWHRFSLGAVHGLYPHPGPGPVSDSWPAQLAQSLPRCFFLGRREWLQRFCSEHEKLDTQDLLVRSNPLSLRECSASEMPLPTLVDRRLPNTESYLVLLKC